jgi:ABC-type multidrug transport system permease subunit
VFHMDVAYDAIVSKACCKRLFKVFRLFQMCVVSFFIWMLHMFHTYVAKSIFQMFQLFHSYVVVSVFILQVFYPDVAYV